MEKNIELSRLEVLVSESSTGQFVLWCSSMICSQEIKNKSKRLHKVTARGRETTRMLLRFNIYSQAFIRITFMALPTRTTLFYSVFSINLFKPCFVVIMGFLEYHLSQHYIN